MTPAPTTWPRWVGPSGPGAGATIPWVPSPPTGSGARPPCSWSRTTRRSCWRWPGALAGPARPGAGGGQGLQPAGGRPGLRRAGGLPRARLRRACPSTGTTVRAGAALSLPVLARRTAAAGLHGLEWAVGVPGSVGGAVRMNAGGHGSDTAATLVAYRWVDLASGAVRRGRPAERLELRLPALRAGRHRGGGGRRPPSSSPGTRRRARRPSTRSSAGAGPTSPGAATPDRCSPTRRATRPAG